MQQAIELSEREKYLIVQAMKGEQREWITELGRRRGIDKETPQDIINEFDELIERLDK